MCRSCGLIEVLIGQLRSCGLIDHFHFEYDGLISTFILSMILNPDLHGLMILISIDHSYVILFSTHSTM